MTSPPYNIGKEYENKLKLEDYIKQQTQVIKCLIAGKDKIVYKGEKTKEELWEKYYIQAPAQRRQPVKRR